MTGSMVITCWNGVISPLSMLSTGRKSSVTQMSSLLPGLGVGDLSGARTGFMSAHANCLGARKSMKRKNWTGNARLAQKKQAAIAAS